MSLPAKANRLLARGWSLEQVMELWRRAHQRRRAQGIPFAKRAQWISRGGPGGGGGPFRRPAPSLSQMEERAEKARGRAAKRDERRDKVAAERFARTKHPETALKHETDLLKKEHGKKADPLIEQLEKGYDVATKIKDKREARRDKRLGDAHARMAREDARVGRKPWAKGRFAGIDDPGWRIKERGRRGAETKEEYVARLGQRGTTDPEGYSVHIPHRLHEKDIAERDKDKSPQEEYLAYHGRKMAKEEKAWRKKTARARLIADARRRRLRARGRMWV